MKKRNFVAIVMAIVLCLSFMTTTSFAEKLINGIVIRANTKEVLKAGETVKPLTFNVVDRDLQGIVDVSFVDWCRVDYNQKPPVEENIYEKTFIEGKVYQYKFKLSITNSDYKFSNNLYIEVDTDPYNVVLKDGQSEYTTSPSLPLIAGPEGPIDPYNPDPKDPADEGPIGPEEPETPETPETPDEPETPEEPEKPEEPEAPETPEVEDDYTPYIPKRPNIPTEKKTDEKSEIKKEENPIEKPAEKAERKVILTINSKDMNNEANGENSHTAMDVAPYIKDGRTMLPIRYIAETLGMSVTWDKKTRTVIIEDDKYKVEIPVDTNKIIVNGETYTSDVKPEIKNGRTMMPIANIARAIGLKDGTNILWDAKTKQVTIIRKIFE